MWFKKIFFTLFRFTTSALPMRLHAPLLWGRIRLGVASPAPVSMQMCPSLRIHQRMGPWYKTLKSFLNSSRSTMRTRAPLWRTLSSTQQVLTWVKFFLWNWYWSRPPSVPIWFVPQKFGLIWSVGTVGVEKSRKFEFSYGTWVTRGTKTAKLVLPYVQVR